MPGRIDTSREDRVVAHIDFANLSVIGNDGTAMILTGMELHTFRVILLIVVAVDTLSLSTLRAKDVVIDDALVVVLQTALADGQFFIRDI